MKSLNIAEQSKVSDAEEYDVKLSAAGDMTTTDIAACVAVIKKGEAVDWSRQQEAAARYSACDCLQGRADRRRGSCQRERRKYVAGISSKSGVEFPPDTLELGYVAVDHDHRNNDLSHRIVKALLSQYPGRLFATTYNDYMKTTLEKAGFVKKGKEWKGRNYMLSFWDKE